MNPRALTASVALGAAGIAALYSAGARARAARASGPSVGRGWTKESDVTLNAGLESMLDAVRAELPPFAAWDLLVTSGVRSAAEQASAMKWRLDNGSTPEQVINLYADKTTSRAVVDLIVAGDMASAAAYLDAHPLSDHQRGGSVDVSFTRYGSGASIPKADREAHASEVRAAAGRAGYPVVKETSVVHIGK